MEIENEGSIASCRARNIEALESIAGYVSLETVTGSYDEQWSLRKVLRCFIWHDRIHAKAMYRMGMDVFGVDKYQRENLVEIKNILRQYQDKT